MAGFHVMKSFQGTLGYIMERFLFEILSSRCISGF